MEHLISQYDLLVNKEFDIRKVYTPRGLQHSVLSHWRAWEDIIIPKGVIEQLLGLIKAMYPRYYNDAMEYLHGWKYRGYDLFIMKKHCFMSIASFNLIFYKS